MNISLRKHLHGVSSQRNVPSAATGPGRDGLARAVCCAEDGGKTSMSGTILLQKNKKIIPKSNSVRHNVFVEKP